LKLIFAILFIVIFSSCTKLPPRRTDKLSILQGITNSKEVEFSIVAPAISNLRFELRDSEGQIYTPEEVKVINREKSTHSVYKVLFIREQTKEYNLYVFDGAALLDQRLVGRGQLDPFKLRLAVASCMNDFYSEQFPIWNALSQKNPEYLLLIGDNVYADKAAANQILVVTPDRLWSRYLDVRLSLPLFFQQKLIPVHAIWDDHDYGENDGHSDYAHKEDSKQIFEAFWAQSMGEETVQKGHGVGSHLSLGDFNLYFLDGRSFRMKDPEGKHLGFEQEKWLFKKLKDENAPSFIIKGDQFFGGYHGKDSFEGKHSKDFAHFTENLSGLKTPFIFLSGDRHYSEIMQFPRSLFKKPSFEITSSGMHSGLRPEDAVGNPWRVVAEANNYNFLMIENLARDNHWFLDVESVGLSGETYFRRELAVYIKDLQNNLDEIRKKRSGNRSYRRRSPKRR
jgi:hypothetical protein